MILCHFHDSIYNVGILPVGLINICLSLLQVLHVDSVHGSLLVRAFNIVLLSEINANILFFIVFIEVFHI